MSATDMSEYTRFRIKSWYSHSTQLWLASLPTKKRLKWLDLLSDQ